MEKVRKEPKPLTEFKPKNYIEDYERLDKLEEDSSEDDEDEEEEEEGEE